MEKAERSYFWMLLSLENTSICREIVRFLVLWRCRKPRAAMGIEIKSDPVGGWTCSACTKVNPPNVTRCVVCSTPKAKPIINKPKKVRRSGKSEKAVEPKVEEKTEKKEIQEKTEKKEIQEKTEKKEIQEKTEKREIQEQREEQETPIVETEAKLGDTPKQSEKNDSKNPDDSTSETPKESEKSEIFSDAHFCINVSLTK